MAKTKGWYSKCSKQELIKFIKDRTSEDVEPKQAKGVLVKRLMDIDADPSGVFDFLSLAQELKDLIYEDLFADRIKSGRPKHTAISRTCKQLYVDLAPAINKGSHITLAIKEECISAILVFPNRGKKVKANLRPLFFRERGLSFLSFRRVENITVQLHYNEQMRSHFYRELFVPDIMRFWPNLLRDYKSLRSLKVVVIDQRHDLDAKPEKLLQILAPLKDLMKLHQDKIVIEGLGNVTRREFTQACCSRAAVFTLSNSAPCECS